MVNRIRRSWKRPFLSVYGWFFSCYFSAEFINSVTLAITEIFASYWWEGKWPAVCMGGMWSPLRCGSQNGKVCVKGVVSVQLFLEQVPTLQTPPQLAVLTERLTNWLIPAILSRYPCTLKRNSPAQWEYVSKMVACQHCHLFCGWVLIFASFSVLEAFM